MKGPRAPRCASQGWVAVCGLCIAPIPKPAAELGLTAHPLQGRGGHPPLWFTKDMEKASVFSSCSWVRHVRRTPCVADGVMHQCR